MIMISFETRLGTGTLLLLSVFLIGMFAPSKVEALTPEPISSLSPRRELSQRRYHKYKVRGRSSNLNDDNRRLQAPTSSIAPSSNGTVPQQGRNKSKGEGGKGGSENETGSKVSMMSKNKGTKASKQKGDTKKSQKGKGSTPKSMKASNHDNNNIFDHNTPETEVVSVQCGSDESPFLTTFVTSIQMQQSSPQQRTNKSRKGKTRRMVDVYDGEEDEQDAFDDVELPFDSLSESELELLGMVFKNVYNQMSFLGCDGFFRTVYSVSMTLVVRNEDNDEYSVTLENTYRMDGTDNMEMRVTNGTMAVDSGPSSRISGEGRRRRLMEFPHFARLFDGSNHTNFSTPNKDAPSSNQPDSPMMYAQTVSGGDDLPIYYVSLAATCRNCQVTEEVNFPLLMHPEGGAYVDTRQGEPSVVTAPVGKESPERVNEENDVCTCPLPVEDNEEETSRQRRRLNGNDLYVPPPHAPTADEYVAAMNSAIRTIQGAGELLRVQGIVALIEPDYYRGENPELVPRPTATPTVSAMPTVSPAPTQSPTISAAPTLTPAPSSTSPFGFGNSSNFSATWPSTKSVTWQPSFIPVDPVIPVFPTIAPTSAAPRWIVSWCGLVVPALALLW